MTTSRTTFRGSGYKIVKSPNLDSDFQLADQYLRGAKEGVKQAELLGVFCNNNCVGWKLFEVNYLKKKSSEIVVLKAKLELQTGKVENVESFGELPANCPAAPLVKIENVVAAPIITQVTPQPVPLSEVKAKSPSPPPPAPVVQTKSVSAPLVASTLYSIKSQQSALEAPFPPLPKNTVSQAPLNTPIVTTINPSSNSKVLANPPSPPAQPSKPPNTNISQRSHPIIIQAEPVAATVAQYFDNPSFVLCDKFVRSQYPYELTKGKVTAAQIKQIKNPCGVMFAILYHSWMGRFEAAVVVSDGYLNIGYFNALPGNPPLDKLCRTWDNGTCKECVFRAYFNNKGHCTEVSILCNTFDSILGDCKSCYPGYVLSGQKCVIQPTSQQTLPPNCSKVNDQKKCVSCFYRYYLDPHGQCQQVSPLCQTWKENGDCLTCYKGYNLTGGACICPAA